MSEKVCGCVGLVNEDELYADGTCTLCGGVVDEHDERMIARNAKRDARRYLALRDGIILHGAYLAPHSIDAATLDAWVDERIASDPATTTLTARE